MVFTDNSLDKKIRRRKLWNRRYKKGLCVYCGKDKHLPRVKHCRSCLDKKIAFNKNYEKKSKRKKALNFKIKSDLILRYGNKCVCCGESLIDLLNIDHINDDGKKERIDKFGYNTSSSIFYKKLLDLPNKRNDLQVLCYNCNIGKYINGGTCPHNGSIRGALLDGFDFSDLRKRSKNKANWPTDKKLLEMYKRFGIKNCQR